MSEFNDESEPQEAITKLIDMLQKREKHKEAIMKEVDKQKEEDEREIMMELWGFANNNTESYHQAFELISAYSGTLRKIRKSIAGIPYPIVTRIYESLSKQLQKDAKLFETIQKLDEKYKAEIDNE